MTEAAAADVVEIAEKYYDSNDADQFYFNVWGGEDIHVGIYERPDEGVREASARTVRTIGEKLDLDPSKRVLDLGAGYGGAARYLAKKYGCRVTCLNLSETQNERNRVMNREQGLADKIDVVHGNFEEIPLEAKAFDVVWSQDAILHSGRRQLVLEEIARVLKPGGEVVFTDPMQADDCPDGVLGPVLARIHLDSLGSFAFYREELGKLGFEEIRVDNLTKQLGRHYARVRQELEGRYDEITKLASKPYVDRMLQGLQHWVDAESKGYLAWGILHFRARS